MRPFRPAVSRPAAQALEPTLVKESAPLDPRNVYAATKVHGEHLLACWARETGGTGVALRFHNVYGPGMPEHTPYAGVAALFRSSLLAGSPPQVFEDGRQRRDFVHVSDVAAAVVAATTAPLGPGCTALNIGSGEVTTIGEVADLLAGRWTARRRRSPGASGSATSATSPLTPARRVRCSAGHRATGSPRACAPDSDLSSAVACA